MLAVVSGKGIGNLITGIHMPAVFGGERLGKLISESEMVAVVVREVIGKHCPNIGFAEVGKLRSLNFKQIEFYLSWWNTNGVSTY